jgi:hypothetical protein
VRAYRGVAFSFLVAALFGSEAAISQDGHPGREVKAHLFGGEAVARFYLLTIVSTSW